MLPSKVKKTRNPHAKALDTLQNSPAYWNKGYATEIGKAVIGEAFRTTNISGIYGMAEPENGASRRVLQKIGMKYLGIREFRDKKDAFYYIGRE